ncbi:uncharacterized protein G2W53_014686 [Senna tora]|uniref:Uncharacterized protein n=1 Tax=Senna tora TaxID=362788 RepID=A0A834WU03_9FABA|nr:uncharacterized protein G2W53_014686 [Senna tora]
MCSPQLNCKVVLLTNDQVPAHSPKISQPILQFLHFNDPPVRHRRNICRNMQVEEEQNHGCREEAQENRGESLSVFMPRDEDTKSLEEKKE